MKKRVFDIEYDTDGEVVDLPTELEITVPDSVDHADEYEVDEYVSDEISNITGFCHNGFQMEDKE